jgi:two-component system cell cycle sensor histidine kinase/response regulator CckA
VLAELSNLIRRLIGENIELDMIHGRDLGMVKADQGQLEQVVINLAVNARDAMPEGGTLRIRTSNVTIDQAGPPGRDMISPEDEDQIIPGEYVLVEMEDSGTGIPIAIIKNIFEPFFSTKEVGSGTGLGLSTVYGIVKQTGGYVYIESEEGKGTVFSLYFKRHERPEPVMEEVAEDTRPTDLTGGETVLLVEDETPVRIFAARALRNKGYEVLEADSGESALSVFSNYEGTVDVIISDVVMPGMNGPKMIEAMHQRYPDRMANIQIIFISGYAENAFGDSFGQDREFNFLAKPFTLKQLAAKVKDVVRKRAAE